MGLEQTSVVNFEPAGWFNTAVYVSPNLGCTDILSL
jgi:hypothetical protein